MALKLIVEKRREGVDSTATINDNLMKSCLILKIEGLYIIF